MTNEENAPAAAENASAADSPEEFLQVLSEKAAEIKLALFKAERLADEYRAEAERLSGIIDELEDSAGQHVAAE